MGFVDAVTRYEDYTVSGGDNYREFLLTLPYKRGLRDAGSGGGSFDGGHFPEENIVAHFRTTDIKGPNGENALFIEEIQSDWAQKGRSGGFKLSDAEKAKEMDKLKAANKEFDQLLNTFEIEIDGKKVPFADHFNSTYEPEEFTTYTSGLTVRDTAGRKRSKMLGLLEEYAQNKQLFKNGEPIDEQFLKTFQHQNQQGKFFKTDENPYLVNRDLMVHFMKADSTIPKAPFVSDEKHQRNWTALSIKRILAKAVEEGYEYVSFATGDVGAAQNYFARSNDGLQKYYGETVPSVLNKLIKKYDSEALVNKGKAEGVEDMDEIVSDEQHEAVKTNVFTDSLKIKLTDKLKNAIKEGQALFAIPAAVTGAGLAMNNDMRN